MRWLVLIRLRFSRKRRLNLITIKASSIQASEKTLQKAHSVFTHAQKEFASKTRQMRQTQPDNTHTVHCFNTLHCVSENKRTTHLIDSSQTGRCTQQLQHTRYSRLVYQISLVENFVRLSFSRYGMNERFAFGFIHT